MKSSAYILVHVWEGDMNTGIHVCKLRMPGRSTTVKKTESHGREKGADGVCVT